VTPHRLADFERAGLLDDVTGEEERRARADLLEDLSDAGVSLDELRRAVAEERLALLPVELVFTRDAKYTVSEVARETGFGQEAVLRNWLALGLPRPAPEDRAFSEAEVEGLGTLRRLQDLGVPEEAQLELARAIGQDAKAGLLHRQLGQLDCALQPGDHHLPHDPVYGLLVELPQLMRGRLRPLDEAVQACCLLRVDLGGGLGDGGGGHRSGWSRAPTYALGLPARDRGDCGLGAVASTHVGRSRAR
jgi:DNA-binding transcriptional MerR regulator